MATPPRSISFNYWEVTAANWPHHLHSLKSQGVDEIHSFIPWGLHESVQGIRDFAKSSRLRLEKFLGIAHQAGLTVRLSLGFPSLPSSFPTWALALGDQTALVPSSALHAGKGDLSIARLPSLHDELFFSPFLEFASDVFALLSLYRFPEGPVVGVIVDWGIYHFDLGLTALPLYSHFLQERYPQASQIGLRYHCTFRDFTSATSAQGTRVLLDKRPWLAAYDYKYCRSKMLEERAQGMLALPSGDPLLDLLSFSHSLVQQKTKDVPWALVMDPTLLEGDIARQAFPFAPLGLVNAQAGSVFRLWEYLYHHAKQSKVPLLSLGADDPAPASVVSVISGRFLPQQCVRLLREWAESGVSLYFPFGLPQYTENLATIEWKTGLAPLTKQGRLNMGRGLLYFSDSAATPEQPFWENLTAFSSRLKEGALA